MLEQWNSGVMGSGTMQYWINGPATGGIDDKIKMAIILLKTNIPAFHHSIIPFSGQIRKTQNKSILSVGCRNSETLNYGPPWRIISDLAQRTRFSMLG